MSRTHDGRSYTTRAVTVGDRRRVDFVMRCAKAGCGVEDTVHMDPNCPPDLVVQKFRQRGWICNERNAAGCFCPACAKPAPKGKPDMTTAKAEPPKGPTTDQLKAIRDELRGCFDADAGHYLDGCTDERLAQRLGVPWMWVKTARDLFDMAIKVDPEIKALRDELTALVTKAAIIEARIEALAKKRAA